MSDINSSFLYRFFCSALIDWLKMTNKLQSGWLTTPRSQMTDIRSSTPLTPFGILVKLSLPSAFCSALNVQLSVPVRSKFPLHRRHQYTVTASLVPTRTWSWGHPILCCPQFCVVPRKCGGTARAQRHSGKHWNCQNNRSDKQCHR